MVPRRAGQQARAGLPAAGGQRGGSSHHRLDRPGYGLSTPQPGRTITGWVPGALAVADHLGIGQFAAVGISTGGAFALALAALAPERVLGVVACCSMTDMRWPEGRATMSGPHVRAVWEAPDRAAALAAATDAHGKDGSKMHGDVTTRDTRTAVRYVVMRRAHDLGCRAGHSARPLGDSVHGDRHVVHARRRLERKVIRAGGGTCAAGCGQDRGNRGAVLAPGMAPGAGPSRGHGRGAAVTGQLAGCCAGAGGRVAPGGGRVVVSPVSRMSRPRSSSAAPS